MGNSTWSHYKWLGLILIGLYSCSKHNYSSQNLKLWHVSNVGSPVVVAAKKGNVSITFPVVVSGCNQMPGKTLLCNCMKNTYLQEQNKTLQKMGLHRTPDEAADLKDSFIKFCRHVWTHIPYSGTPEHFHEFYNREVELLRSLYYQNIKKPSVYVQKPIQFDSAD